MYDSVPLKGNEQEGGDEEQECNLCSLASSVGPSKEDGVLVVRHTGSTARSKTLMLAGGGHLETVHARDGLGMRAMQCQQREFPHPIHTEK